MSRRPIDWPGAATGCLVVLLTFALLGAALGLLWRAFAWVAGW